MEKVERLISIIMVLLQKDIVSATEFAKLFSVSKRTILRDMETLGMSNIPIYAINGVKGGYGIMEEYKLDKRLLNSQDLENILTALSGLEQIMLSQEVELTIRKIESMVHAHAQKGLIQLSFYDWKGRSEIHQVLKICQEAVAKGRLISFDYIDKDGNSTKRMVEPYRLHFSETSWYLKGFCLERRGYRTFKLSRTENLQMELKTFSPREDLEQNLLEAHYQPELIEVKAWIAPAIRDQFIERYGRNSVAILEDESLLATFQIPYNQIGFQLLAGFGTNLRILEPVSYADDFRMFLHSMIENTSRTNSP